MRDDLSNRLIHLTRDSGNCKAEDIFLKIIRERKLVAGNNDIKGGYNVVCFTEAPISKLGMILNQNYKNIRYRPFGFMFKKDYLFKKGARPAIYQTKQEYELLPDELKYKHVTFELDDVKKIDWTWEREWRIKCLELIINPDEVTVIVPSKSWVDKFKEENSSHNSAMSMILDGLLPNTPLEWHFLVLEDLGFDKI